MSGAREPWTGYGPGPRFVLFSQLPIELRLAIWDLNLPPPRIVPIRCGRAQPIPISPEEPRGRDGQPFQCTSSSPIPVNLHVCRESRIEAMKLYKLIFGTERDIGRIFFNPLIDTLYFGARDGNAASEAQFEVFTRLVSHDDLSLIRRVAINETLVRGIDGISRIDPSAGSATSPIPFTSPASPSSPPSLTIVQVLYQVGMHFRGLEQLTFVCNDRNPVYSADAVLVEPGQRNRLVERRIGDAVQAIEDRWPGLGAPTPPWNIRAIASDPDPPTCDRRILGYGRSSFGHFQKRKKPWVGSQCACNSCGSQKPAGLSDPDFEPPSSALGWDGC